MLHLSKGVYSSSSLDTLSSGTFKNLGKQPQRGLLKRRRHPEVATAPQLGQDSCSSQCMADAAAPCAGSGSPTRQKAGSSGPPSLMWLTCAFQFAPLAPSKVHAFLQNQHGWLSKLWSPFGSPIYWVPHYPKDPKRDHNFDPSLSRSSNSSRPQGSGPVLFVFFAFLPPSSLRKRCRDQSSKVSRRYFSAPMLTGCVPTAIVPVSVPQRSGMEDLNNQMATQETSVKANQPFSSYQGAEPCLRKCCPGSGAAQVGKERKRKASKRPQVVTVAAIAISEAAKENSP